MSMQLEMFAEKLEASTSGLPPKFKPLLAEKVDLELLTFPQICSPKIDGFRCVIDPLRGALTRNLKPIPNKHVREQLNCLKLDYLDGEIVTYTDGDLDDFNTVQSKITTNAGRPDFAYHVFDSFINPNVPYRERSGQLVHDPRLYENPMVRLVPTVHVHDLESLLVLEKHYVDELGWEGVMLRKYDGHYKYGRSTLKEGILLKMKRFIDDEATIVGYKEKMHNANEAKVNALGYTERQTLKENMVPDNCLGAFICAWRDVFFDLGTGFDQNQRDDYWVRRDELMGKKVTFKYQGVGPNGKPRFPVFKGLRHDSDL